MELYLAQPEEWESDGGLGNRQVQALQTWLRTTGLRHKQGETWLAGLFRRLGTDDLLPWQYLWVNVTHGFATVGWYACRLGLGEWSTTELVGLLLRDVPHLSPRTAKNAVAELVGTLERTPVGAALGQGEVRAGRPRSLRRTGLPEPATGALLRSLALLWQAERRRALPLSAKLAWPWLVFGCKRDSVLLALDERCRQWLDIGDETISLRGDVEEWVYADLR